LAAINVQRRVAPGRALPHIRVNGGHLLMRGSVVGYISLIVLLPLAAVINSSARGGLSAFWQAVTDPASVSALELSVGASLAVVAVNAVFGTLIAWVLVRDNFPGKAVVNALIDLPFALPTIVAGLTLLALYGPDGNLGVNLAYTRAGIVLALLFVTLPFVVRSVQPVLIALDTEVEEAAAALGAGPLLTFRRLLLPALAPAILSGSALGFARAIGEFGSVVLISGNIPLNTEVAAVHVYGLLESDDPAGAAAVAVVLLTIALVMMLLLQAFDRWGSRHEG
jgi:sulfate/thiosulfate transport system permease protein